MNEAELAGSQPEITVPETTDVEQVPAGGTPAATESEKPDPNVTANGERLDRQTRNWRALERDRDHWREMAMRPQVAPAAPEPEATTGKTPADFNYDDGKYQAYLFREVEARAVSAARRELEQKSQQDAHQRNLQSFKSRESEFAKKQSDYYEIAYGEGHDLSTAMAQAIAESDEGPALAYHLAKNPAVSAQIAMMSPLGAARELGRIEARLIEERVKAKAPVVSKTPPPPPSISGTDSSLVGVKPTEAESDKLSDDEWMRQRAKQVKRKTG